MRTTVRGSLTTVSSSSGVQGSGSVGSSSSLDDDTVVKMTSSFIAAAAAAEPTIKEGIDNPALSIGTKEEEGGVIDSPL